MRVCSRRRCASAKYALWADESYDSARMIYSKRDGREVREIIEHDSRMHAERLFLVSHEGMRAKSPARAYIVRSSSTRDCPAI